VSVLHSSGVRRGETHLQEGGGVSWVKLDDQFAEDELVAELTDRAFRLHVIALCYCGRNLTDGMLDPRAIRVVCAVLTASKASRWVTELVASGLWIEHPNGWYEIKNYLDFNPSEAHVKEERRKARERMSKKRSEERSPEQTPERSPSPSRPVPKDKKTSMRLVGENRKELLDDFEAWAEKVGLTGKQKAEARRLGPTDLEDVLLQVRCRGDVDNPASYFTVAVASKHAENRPFKSEVPLEQRLEVYVRNEGHEYSDELLSADLRERGADAAMVARLLVRADEIRNEEAA
jgi:hypothetical protein